MSRKVSLRWHWSVGLLVLELILSAGCEQFFGDEDLDKIGIAPEKLRRIETLDLERVDGGQVKEADANKPALEQLDLSLEQCRA